MKASLMVGWTAVQKDDQTAVCWVQLMAEKMEMSKVDWSVDLKDYCLAEWRVVRWERLTAVLTVETMVVQMVVHSA